MVEEVDPAGVFDDGVEPTVQICELNGLGCVVPLIAQFTLETGPGSETIRLVSEEEHFIVNWHTKDFGLDPSKTYRIQVVVSGEVLGIADVDVVASGSGLKRVDTGLYVPLKDDRTLPIKFRIEQGAVCPATISDLFDSDLGLWTEHDEGDRITLDYAGDGRLEFEDWKRYYDGFVHTCVKASDFSLDFDMMLSAAGGNARVVGPGLATEIRNVGEYLEDQGIQSHMEDGVFALFYRGQGPRLYLVVRAGGVWESNWWDSPASIPVPEGAVLHGRLEKNGGNVTLSVFSDQERTVHLPGSPKSVNSSLGGVSFSTLYALNGLKILPASWNWEWSSGWIDNLHFQKIM
ncbi:MAG: hypothetical protein HKO65_02190 [Gemmatimonadetes bacterium]|nr:hypothetical protein [Gemmatimonadota bacterium]NNM03886.1 hypothetical protein [Gemmatimonadota bacterium]